MKLKTIVLYAHLYLWDLAERFFGYGVLRHSPYRPLIYLACPYSDPSEAVMLERFADVTRAAAGLSAKGYVVYSPITHSHPMRRLGRLSNDWEFWKRMDMTFLSLSNTVAVLQLPGWKESVGVTEEIRIAKAWGINVIYLPVDTLSHDA